MGIAQATGPARSELVAAPSDIESEQSIPQFGDGDSDIEILKSVPQHFQIVDDDSANWLVRRVMDSRAYAARVKEWAEAELRRANREEQTLLFLFGRQIETWAKSEIDKLKGRRKSLNLPAGCVGYRSVGTRLVVDNEAVVLNWAKRYLPAAVVVVEKLSKSALNEHCEKTGELPDDGVHIEPPVEKFFIR